MKLDLHDLQPKEAQFNLGETALTLRKFTLASQIWTQQRFGTENIQGIFSNLRLGEISEIAYYLLKDKKPFPTLESFQEAVVTQRDKMNLIQALLDTVGISQPVIERLNQENPTGNEQSPSQSLTGAKSSTESQTLTDGPSTLS